MLARVEAVRNYDTFWSSKASLLRLSFGDASLRSSQKTVEQTIKCVPNCAGIVLSARREKSFADQRADLLLPDLQRNTTQSPLLAGSVETHALGAGGSRSNSYHSASSIDRDRLDYYRASTYGLQVEPIDDRSAHFLRCQ